MKTARELWQYISKNGLKPLPKTSVSQWADNYRMLSSGISAEPGKWKTSRAPYQKDIMNAFTEPGIHRVVVKSSSQIGKSDMMNNVIGRFAHLDPCAIMMIQPTIDMAQDYSKTRIAPMIKDTKVLNNLFYDVKSRDANNTILSKVFPGGRLIMCGANSPAGLASRPIRILLADEVDRFPDSAGTEGDPVDLAAKRMTTFWNSCMGLFSTPTNEGSSRIDEEYLAGTQEEWQHKCPNCGEYHLLRHIDMTVDYKEIKTPSGKKTVIVNDVKWRCPHCGFSFSEKEMKQTPQKYISRNADALKNGIRSFFVNGFTSPWMTWTRIMREWLEAKGDPEREKVIMNTVFGESYTQKGAFEDEQIFLRRRESYGAELPNGVLLLTAAIDTQDNRLEYEVVGWGKEEECWGIRKGIVLGAPNQARTWKEIDSILDKTYHFADRKGLKVVRTFIDSGGHYTSDVYNYCQKNFHKQRFAIKGRGGPGIPLIYKIAKANNAKAPLILLGVDDGKQQIMDRLSIDSPGPLYFHFPQDEGIKELSNRGYDDLYFKGIISEHKKVYKRNGVLREVWETTKNVRNEPLDLRNYNLACMKSLKPDWVKLEMLVNGMSETEIKKAVAKPQKKKAVYRAKRQVNIW